MLLAGSAPAQEPGAVDKALFEQGRELFEQNCAGCHQSGGGGSPPTFPALNGNQNLQDLSLIVGNVHQGKGAMPAFTELSAEQIAALATYVRNAWDNQFGGATPEEVATIISALGGTTAQLSVWDGVFTQEQADRGEGVHAAVCSRCHGRRLDGAGDADMPVSPAIAKSSFLRKWDGQSLEGLFEFIRATMPPINPGSLSDDQYIDAIAHMLAVSEMPAGEKELPADPKVLAGIVIRQEPETSM
jgi:mono/diheme cytochrome c family protein